MLFLVGLLLVQLCIAQPTPPGTPVQFDSNALLGIMNAERLFWNIPILDYDDGIAQIAQQSCEQCQWTNLGSSEERGPKLGYLKGFTYTGAKYQTTGELHAGAAGPGADPALGLPWLHRSDWDCATEACNASTCLDYTGLVWMESLYVGCGRCTCPADTTPLPGDPGPWEYLTCVFNAAGNSGGHPFGAVKDQVCARTYVPPPPIPQPVCQDCTTGCASPAARATCNAQDKAWHLAGPATVSEIDVVDVNCQLVIDGDLTGNAGERLNVSVCGLVNVTGNVVLNGDVGVELDFLQKAPLIVAPAIDAFQQFIAYTTISGGTWLPPVARNVFTPSLDLCGKSLKGDKGSFVYLYNCGIAAPAIGVLPGGGALISQSVGAETSNPPSNGGDINDSDLNTGEKGTDLNNYVPPSPGGGGLPGWAIFLIVLAVLIAVAVIIVIIFFVFVGKDDTERF